MKAFSWMILFATVVSLNTPVHAADTDDGISVTLGAGDQCTALELKGKDATECWEKQKTRENSKKCDDKSEATTKAFGEAKKACSGAGLSLDKEKRDTVYDCITKADQCNDIKNAEPQTESEGGNVMNMLLQATGQNSALGNLSSLFGNNTEEVDPEETKGQCYSSQEYKDEKKSLQDDLKEQKEKIADLKKDINEAQKDAEEARDEAQKALNEAQKNARLEDQELKDAKREAEVKDAAANAEGRSNVANLNVEIIQTQGALSDAILSRVQALSQLTEAMINRKCAEMIIDANGKLRSMKDAPVGSQNSLIRNASQQHKNNKQDFEQCRKENLLLREKTVAATQAQIDGLNATIQAKMDQVSDINKGLALVSTQKTQKAQEDATNEQIKNQERTNEQQNIVTGIQNQNQITTQKITELQAQISEAEKAKNNASARLALLGTAPGKSTTPEEAKGKVDEYESAYEACKVACGSEANRCTEDERRRFGLDVMATGKKTEPATTGSPAASGDGTTGTGSNKGGTDGTTGN